MAAGPSYLFHVWYFLQESAFCAMISQPDAIPLAEISSIIFFIIPMIVIIYQYTNMGIVIHRTTKNNDKFGNTGNGSVHGRRRRMLHTKKIIKMLCKYKIYIYIFEKLQIINK